MRWGKESGGYFDGGCVWNILVFRRKVDRVLIDGIWDGKMRW